MGEVVTADAVTIAVTTGNYHVHLMIGHLNAGGHSQRSAVEGVHPIGIYVPWQVGGAPDTAYGHNLMGPESQFRNCTLDGVQHTKVAAAGTPVRIRFALKVRRSKVYLCSCHGLTSINTPSLCHLITMIAN